MGVLAERIITQTVPMEVQEGIKMATLRRTTVKIFFVNTVYQLFLVINMKLQNVVEGEADLVVSNHTPSLKQYLSNLKNSGLFRKLFYKDSLSIVTNFWQATEADKREAFYKIERDCKKGEIDFTEYDALYTANFSVYINAIYYSFPHMSVYFYEDGASVCAVDWRKSFSKYSYIHGFMSIFDHISGVYLNSPELMSVDLGWPLIQLPKIEKSDTQVRKIYNSIFQYDGSFHFPPFVFVEQSFQVDNVTNNDLDFMQAACDIVGYDNFLVKAHPRNTVNRPFETGCSRKIECVLPFELLLLNSQPDETVFITVSSTSLISPWVLFGEKPRTILLYKAVTGGINISAIDQYDVYLDRFVKKYQCRELMVPQSMNEYRKMLKRLGNDYWLSRRCV